MNLAYLGAPSSSFFYFRNEDGSMSVLHSENAVDEFITSKYAPDNYSSITLGDDSKIEVPISREDEPSIAHIPTDSGILDVPIRDVLWLLHSGHIRPIDISIPLPK
jgi:hypothetical protein